MRAPLPSPCGDAELGQPSWPQTDGLSTDFRVNRARGCCLALSDEKGSADLDQKSQKPEAKSLFAGWQSLAFGMMFRL
jgi:hypothetical protein